ncbi:FAD-dependent oxidoreductase [Streptomyces sp. NPDC047985]|uniref:FAD-dependent oxidoreductase n=1 Tax=unclassified Streptomyces TaxID=2593676 RepID=UPI00341922F4
MTVPHHRAPDTGVVGVLDLCRAGRREAVPAASDEPGGRVCTDRRDSYLLDRGCQVFDTSCPQARRRGGTSGLRRRPFTPGFGANRPGRDGTVFRQSADPRGTDTRDRRRIAVRTLGAAPPATRPPSPSSRTTRCGPGRYVCGDHRTNGAVPGAPVSGTRAARETPADPARS